MRGLEGGRLRRLAELDCRQSFSGDGYLSSTAWLADRFHVDWSSAGREVRTAKALQQMPMTTAGVSEGEASLSAVRVLVEAREEHPDACAASEGALVEAALFQGALVPA